MSQTEATLLQACRDGNLEVVKECISNGVEPNCDVSMLGSVYVTGFLRWFVF